MSRPFIVGIGGFESNVGKTTLMCNLLQAFPGWEAIKTTRGHFRSCGKHPHACCVSHLLTDEPLILSGKALTYADGKDTGRYWMAGAANVHWLIVTDSQLENGIHEVLARIKSPGVLIEGNSFTKFVEPDYFLMVKHRNSEKIKTTAKQSLPRANALFLSDIPGDLSNQTIFPHKRSVPSKVYSHADLSDLIDDIQMRFSITTTGESLARSNSF